MLPVIGINMPADKKDAPTGQDGQQQPKPTEVSTASDNGGRDGGDKKFGGEFHNAKTVLEIVGLIVALIIAALGAQAWLESRIDNAVENKMRTILSDETILRRIAAEAHPSLIFNGKGSILHDMGALPFIKPDSILVTGRTHLEGTKALPQKIHISFMKPVSFPPIVTVLNDTATITASNGKGLDWEFSINWIIVPIDSNDEDLVFRLDVVP
jgi:hypothetical protein